MRAELESRIRRILLIYLVLRLQYDLDYYVARDIILLIFDADDVSIAFQRLPPALAAPGPAVGGV